MAKSTKKPAVPSQVKIDFIKSNFYRVVRGDGVFGGLNPNGTIHLGVYSERVPYPQQILHDVENGQLQPEDVSRRVGRGANVLREMEVGISMDVAQAIVLRNWLDEKLLLYQQLVGPLPEIPEAPTVNAGPVNSTKNRKRNLQ
ncbi:hypothetical protein [Bradyrhizobium sp. CB2312]|uniref:hypothetical protein n=1 Tax=Bradyrhizobium sp. CB2312 TaxID=3039155 RepID=UPI0024B26B76|nr:hypothetical protein [Bradyrhizobium sp. CB2312]WFU68584.1 hypothetical protein QA642_24980 [Bradyrhizobium sp. CB2312]